MTEPTRTVLDLGDVILRVRGIEVVDDQGVTRIRLGVRTDGPCEVVAIHPFDPDEIAVLSAGADVEDDDNPGANIYITDGLGHSVDLDSDGLRRFADGWRVA